MARIRVSVEVGNPIVHGGDVLHRRPCPRAQRCPPAPSPRSLLSKHRHHHQKQTHGPRRIQKQLINLRSSFFLVALPVGGRRCTSSGNGKNALVAFVATGLYWHYLNISRPHTWMAHTAANLQLSSQTGQHARCYTCLQPRPSRSSCRAQRLGLLLRSRQHWMRSGGELQAAHECEGRAHSVSQPAIKLTPSAYCGGSDDRSQRKKDEATQCLACIRVADEAQHPLACPHQCERRRAQRERRRAEVARARRHQG